MGRTFGAHLAFAFASVPPRRRNLSYAEDVMLKRALIHQAVLALVVAACLTPAGASAQVLIATIETGSNPHAVAVDSAANRVYVANHYAGTVSVVDALTNTVVFTVPAYAAWDLAPNPTTNRLYVSREAAWVYAVFDSTNGSLLATVPARGRAGYIAVNPRTDRVYVSNTYDNVLRVFDGTTHEQIAAVPVSNWLSARVVDVERNLVYAANYGAGTLLVLDGATNTVIADVFRGTSGNSWGVAVNSRTNKIYLTKLNTIGGGQLVVLNRDTLETIKTLTLDGAAGVAVNERTNRVYVTLYGQGSMAVLDGATDTVATYVAVGGKWPERVQVHTDLGRVYVTDGFTTNTVSVFQDVPPNAAPTANAGPDQTVECAGCAGTPVTLDGSASTDPDGDLLSYAWRNAEGTVVGSGAQLATSVPPGTHTFTLTVTDGDGATSSDTVDVTVQDTAGPEVTRATAAPATLWPPDGRVVPVSITVDATDACDASVSCRIVAARSSESETVRGAGNRAPDVEITGVLTLQLRAERSGSGPGRIYTATIECQDAAGNVSTRDVQVRVPHDRR
ncbi:MAG: hypothetical protein A3H96_10300 [Acidobacteria bacterium RIFCSPLOWO2_02_FULL_67_36]|nr:MAG: hypothetical protein A3H96_10300 [Acidobacteria bacterium RIFCSPLOWO2_02_FULL_67_36]OFW24429.1 MAG: hypothetical protein A3G21_17870 [Acidobacteria bacterium RIFCSPLOWO2_12_FULL_66_21]